MAEKELKKLKRSDLLEILLQQNREMERLQKELEDAKKQLSSREILLAESGSIAEAAMGLNGVFAAAQAACQQYEENIRRRSEQQETMCARMEQETKEKCDRMVAEAQKQADAYWQEAEQKIQQVLQETEGLKKLLSI